MIVVAVVTYRRIGHLEALLPLLVDQAKRCSVTTEVLVVDNDPNAEARPVVMELEGSVRYVHEPQPGISAARNRALDEASGARAVIFIDDDERPGADWLATLVNHWRGTAAVAIKGPTLFTFETTLSAWLTAGGFFEPARMPTGTQVLDGGAGNMLLNLNWINNHGLRFDNDFGLSGGEDTLFTRQIVKLGGVIEWNDEAFDYEMVPASRATPKWVLRRSLRQGNTWARVALRLSETPAERLSFRLRLVCGGLTRLVVGSMRTGMGMIMWSKLHQARGLRTASRGVGFLLGACGRVHYEYGRGKD